MIIDYELTNEEIVEEIERLKAMNSEYLDIWNETKSKTSLNRMTEIMLKIDLYKNLLKDRK